MGTINTYIYANEKTLTTRLFYSRGGFGDRIAGGIGTAIREVKMESIAEILSLMRKNVQS